MTSETPTRPPGAGVGGRSILRRAAVLLAVLVGLGVFGSVVFLVGLVVWWRTQTTPDLLIQLPAIDARELGKPLRVYGVTDVAFSPDGRTLALGGSEFAVAGPGSVWFVNVRTRKHIAILVPGSGDFGATYTFSPNGRTFASAGLDSGTPGSVAGFDPSIRLWDVRTRKPTGTLVYPHTGSVQDMAFSPDGRLLASTADDSTTRLWDMRTHKQIGSPLGGHTSDGVTVAFSPDGRIIADSAADHTVRLWDVRTHKEIGTPLRGHTDQVLSLAFSPDGRTLASGGGDNTVRLWDVRTHKQLATLAVPRAVFSVAISPDGRTLALGDDVGGIRLWNLRTHKQIGTPLRGHTLFIESLDFCPDGRTLASASLDDTVRLWNVKR